MSMNLTLSPEQFLVIYNCMSTSPSITAQEIKLKMDVILLDSLSVVYDSKNRSKYLQWIKQEHEKISTLQSELKVVMLSMLPDDAQHNPAPTM